MELHAGVTVKSKYLVSLQILPLKSFPLQTLPFYFIPLQSALLLVQVPTKQCSARTDRVEEINQVLTSWFWPCCAPVLFSCTLQSFYRLINI